MQTKEKRSGPKSVFDSEENLKELTFMYESGCSMQEAAVHFGVSLKSCYRALEKARNKYGKKLVKPYRGFFSDKKKYQKLVKMYRENRYSMKEIAKYFGVSVTTCYKALNDVNPKARFSRTILGDEEKQAEFLEMKKSGCSMKQIADHFDVCLATAYRVFGVIKGKMHFGDVP